MSYAEHGPRIFLANRSNGGTPLIYGDYVLPKKRIEGRLKLYDSCSDIRAWSPNYVEHSRYFRELNENGSPVGKIIPFNVVIDNIIQLNSQTQNELQIVKKELEKYKSLQLSPKQEQQLRSLENKQEIKELLQNDNCTSQLKDAFLNISKSVPAINSNSYLSIHVPFRKHFQNKTKDKPILRIQPNEIHSYSATAVDPSLNNSSLVSTYQSIKSLITEDINDKPAPWIEYIDVGVQVDIKPCNIEKIDNQIDKYLNKTSSLTPAISRASFTPKYSDQDTTITELDSSSIQTNNDKEQSFECDASCSESSQNIETECSFDSHQSTHKAIIIQKDSEIISLEYKLRARDDELEELRDANKELKISLSTQQENLKMIHDRFFKLYHQHNYEVESLKQQLHDYKHLIEQLQKDLNDKCKTCHLQSQEIEKLQLCNKDVAMLQSEKNCLLKKLQEMEQSIKNAKTYNLEKIKCISQQKDELEKQNYEQSCMITDQEEEITQLLDVIKETSITYEEQMKTKDMLENLKAEIHNKNIKISQYEKQLVSIKQEISDFFNNLKHALNNLEDLNGSCEDICNCANCDLDINEEANNVLLNINVIMTRFQSYKIESQNLLQQLQELKQCIENNKQQIHLNQSLENIICEDCYYESDLKLKNTSGKTNVIVLRIEQNKSSVNELEFEDDISTSITNHNCLDTTNNNFNFYKHETECDNRIVELNQKTNVDKEGKKILEYFSHFLIKLRSLTQQMKIYVETERPFIIKLIYSFYDILENIQSAINISQDITMRKQHISNLYNQHKEEYMKCAFNIKELPPGLLKIQNKINEFIGTILWQLLDEILHKERNTLHDKQINHAFEMYFKSCIDRVNNALHGAGDHHIQIVEEIEKQQKELQKKDTEIAQLKEEVAQHLARRGEGDCLHQRELENSIAIKEQLSKVTAELSNKNGIILKLKDQLQIFKNELSTHNKNRNALKKKNKNYNNIKDKKCLLLTVKNKIIKNLSQRLSEVNDVNVNMTSKLMEIERKLCDIKHENRKLQDQIMQADTIISNNNKTIINLKDNIEKNENIVLRNITEHQNVVKEKDYEIVKLRNENELSSAKLKDMENKLIKMNQTITSLTEQHDKINIIYMMQEDFAKLDKSEKKLKAELNSLKMQIVNDQNNNKKLNNNLDTLISENESLQKSIEYWKNENSELSIKLCNEVTDVKLKNQLYTLSNKILDRLSILKKQSTVGENLPTHHFNEQLQNKHTIYQDQLADNDANDVNKINYINRNLKSKSKDPEKEIKENEIEEIELQEQLNIENTEKYISSNDCITFEFESSKNNNKNIKHKAKSDKNGHYRNKNEIEKLLNEIEIKNCKIRNYTETIQHLTQENTDLRAILKTQAEEYQTKLVLMKKRYDSSLNAVNERHKESVEILQKQFEDNLKSERIFEPENWLQSLNMKELVELYERISVIINSNENLICTKNKNQFFCEKDVQKQFYTEIREIEERLHMTEKNMYEKTDRNNILKLIQDDSPEKQWPLTILSDMQNYPTLQTQDDKPSMEHNIKFPYCEEKSPVLENKYKKEKQAEKDSTFDQQRWNFINQCSAYHKLSNNYEYSRSIHTD
ncbi:uncharacterized protein LOC100883153 isoform X4 [Megachile rotundata]|uniref:uncharacterized protein LOC100883153 isoform X4 n=1 Tax=Megachile rotundata TaxID=143995 RepID=UPI003FD5145B